MGLMTGKRGLVMGVANDHSIAWGIAKALSDQGASLAFTYQGEVLQKRVEPLAASVNSNLVIPCDEAIEVSTKQLHFQLASSTDGFGLRHTRPSRATEETTKAQALFSRRSRFGS